MKPFKLNHKQKLSTAILVSFLLMLSGCASTWVQQSPQWQPKKNVQVLVGHYGVKSDAGADLLDLAKQGAGGVSFADMSKETYKLMKVSLKKFNLNLVTDKRRAKKLDHGIELTTGDKRADELIGSLASQWTHPETTSNAFHRILAGTDLRKQVVGKLKWKNKSEGFLSAYLKIEDQDQYLLFKRFRLILSIQILDQKGEAVFQAKTEGFSGLKFLRNPISGDRIQIAMADALSKLEKAEIEKKISTITSL